jgi:hypothetical protein
MTCLAPCGGIVPLPPRGAEAACETCGRRYREIHDYGFFTYTAELYVPVEP